MRLSIATRVSLACAILIGVSLLLLLAGLKIGNGIHDANARVAGLSRALQAEDARDAAQRRLRLTIGELTRHREQGAAVSATDWDRLSHRIDAFASLNTHIGSPLADAPAAQAAETRTAARAMVKASQRLIRIARTDPAGIKREMPAYLSSLRQLEDRQFAEREAIAREIVEAVRKNAAEGRRNILRVLVGGLLIVLVVTAMAIWLRTRLLSPIAVIARRLRRFEADASATPPCELARDDEVGDLSRGLAEFRTAVDKLRGAERRADYLARHDVLTGLANRLQFEDRLARELAFSRQTAAPLALFAIDLDNFKGINDRHGHAGGDRALKRAAEILNACVGEADLVARLGGDEFAILQLGKAQPAAAEALARRLLHCAAATAHEPIEIQMSIGMAVAAGDLGREELHNAADLALYSAKSAGRNQTRLFDAPLREREQLRVRLGRDLEHAIARDQLHLVYQPIADAATLRVIGHEALLRWRHPSLGDIAPDLFIPVAENTGLIEEIGLWVVDRALAAASGWNGSLSLALNLSPLQFRKPGFAQALLRQANRYGVAIGRLELEVTENAMLQGAQRSELLDSLRVLQAAGARIVMDDFGTGHSTLNNLRDFRFDKLKIDRSFIAELRDHQSSAVIVKAIIALAKSLGQQVVAEGVESPVQLAELKFWGCDQVQGYLIGRPLPEPVRAAAGVAASLTLAR